MSLERIPGGLTEDRLRVLFSDEQCEALDRTLNEFVRQMRGYAWFIENEGTVHAKAGNPPSELTFEMRKAAVEGWPDMEEQQGMIRQTGRRGTSLRRIPPTAWITVRPNAVLIVAPARDSSFSFLMRLLDAARVSLEAVLLEALWVVPSPDPINLPEEDPPPHRA